MEVKEPLIKADSKSKLLSENSHAGSSGAFGMVQMLKGVN